jgi:hypothetical protein
MNRAPPATLGPTSSDALSLAGFLTVFLGVLGPAPAHAQRWPTTDPGFNKQDESLANPVLGFGTPGQIVITSDFDLDLRYVSETLGGFSQSGPQITVSPAIMFFLAPRLAVGALMSFQHESRENDSASTFVFGPGVAYNIPISARASIFPTLGLTYTWWKTSTGTAGGRTTRSGTELGLLLKSPVLFHPFTHVFVGFGPIIVVDLTSSAEGSTPSKTRSFGLTMDLGLWL